MNNEELLNKLVEHQKKQTFYTRIMCVAVLVIAAGFLIGCISVFPHAIKTLQNVDGLITDATDILSDAEVTLSGIDGMSSEIKKAGEGINSMVDDNSAILAESVEKMNNIDFEGLNRAIKDLGDVVEPLAGFFNRFK